MIRTLLQLFRAWRRRREDREAAAREERRILDALRERNRRYRRASTLPRRRPRWGAPPTDGGIS